MTPELVDTGEPGPPKPIEPVAPPIPQGKDGDPAYQLARVIIASITIIAA